MSVNFLTSNKVTPCATAAATATTEVATSAVDTQGYNGVTFVRSTSAIRTLKLQGGTTSTSATNDISGATVTATAGAVVKIEIHKPSYRFVRMTSTEGVTSILGDAVAILSGPSDEPVSNDSDAFVAVG